MHALGAERQRVAPARRIECGDDGARLHVVADKPVVDDRDLGDLRGGGKSGVGRRLVTERELEGDVCAPLRPDERRVRVERAGRIDHRRQRIVIDVDQLGRRFRAVQVVRNHIGDGVADMPHDLAAQHRIERLLDRGLRVGFGEAWHQPEIAHIGRRPDKMHAGSPARGGEVANLYARMAGGGAQHIGDERSLRRDIRRIASLPADQRAVLDAARRRAHSELERSVFVHCKSSWGSKWARLAWIGAKYGQPQATSGTTGRPATTASSGTPRRGPRCVAAMRGIS